MKVVQLSIFYGHLRACKVYFLLCVCQNSLSALTLLSWRELEADQFEKRLVLKSMHLYLYLFPETLEITYPSLYLFIVVCFVISVRDDRSHRAASLIIL